MLLIFVCIRSVDAHCTWLIIILITLVIIKIVTAPAITDIFTQKNENWYVFICGIGFKA